MKKRNDTDEITLESWQAERRQMEEELARESAEFRAVLDKARQDESMPPEMKEAFLAAGDKMLEADDWLKGMYASTTEIIAHCDEMEAKLKALDMKAKSKSKATAKGAKKGKAKKEAKK